MFNQGFPSWVLFALAVWFGFRLLMTLVVIVLHCLEGGWDAPALTKAVAPCALVSALLGGIGGAVAWRFFLPAVGAFLTPVLNVASFLAGFFAGMLIDLILVIRGERLSRWLLATRL